MKYFKMGEEVMVSAILKPGYFTICKREWKRFKIKPRKAFYVGIAWKHEGDCSTDHQGFGTHLRNIKAIKVIRFKFNERANDKFALLQDVRRVEG